VTHAQTHLKVSGVRLRDDIFLERKKKVEKNKKIRKYYTTCKIPLETDVRVLRSGEIHRSMVGGEIRRESLLLPMTLRHNRIDYS